MLTTRSVAFEGTSTEAPVCVCTARKISPKVEFRATMVNCPLRKNTCGAEAGICSSVGGGGGGGGGCGAGAGSSCFTARLRALFFEIWAEAMDSVSTYAASNVSTNLGCRANIKA